MALLNAKNAAVLANGAYSVTHATTNQQATAMAKAETRFVTNSPNVPAGQSVNKDFNPIGGIVGTSGVVVREQSGFGVLLERCNGMNNEFVMVMRGTQTTVDWLSNLNIGMSRGPTGSLVHQGFMAIYESMRVDVAHMIGQTRAAHVHFVGHSLGGALASLAALQHARTAQGGTSLYTFGAPRVGSMGMISDINRLIGVQNVKRVYALSDPVPMIPLFPFLHCPSGASAINAGFGSITANAHDMTGCYVPNMPAQGWPAAIATPNKASPDYWLKQAEKQSGIGSKLGYYFLGKALEGIMPALHLLCGGLSANMTLLDLLSEGIKRAVMLSREMGEYILRFVKSALRFTVGVFDAALSVADMTASFLRYVLSLMMTQVTNAARAALNKLL